ncbi:hypothetical protein ACVGVM_13610 [Pseudonocardia bannensis]|uniref:Uncharacterized protein n=1 Tax=Pseudonocardia bannensis TaxID=630973 RepID=A0A848DQX0_9PSEU|nr:hypothetical protein [Pseudonocardia bannensis]NMH95227.1 hypothetical protein [Pseudonocardia bannensis]
MILLCERCFAPIGNHEDYVRLAHLDRARPDGTIDWIHTYVHTTACVEEVAQRPTGAAPDTGSWDAARRGLSPAAARWSARRAPRHG